MKTDAALPDLLAGLSGHQQQLVSKQKWLKLWEEGNRVITAEDHRPSNAPSPAASGREAAAGSSAAATPGARQEFANGVNLLQLALQRGSVPAASAAVGPAGAAKRPPPGMQQLTLSVAEQPRPQTPHSAGQLAAAKAAGAALRQLQHLDRGITNLQINIKAGEVQLWLRDYRKGFLSRLETLLGDIKILLQNSGLKLSAVKINGEVYRRY